MDILNLRLVCVWFLFPWRVYHKQSDGACGFYSPWRVYHKQPKQFIFSRVEPNAYMLEHGVPVSSRRDRENRAAISRLWVARELATHIGAGMAKYARGWLTWC